MNMMRMQGESRSRGAAWAGGSLMRSALGAVLLALVALPATALEVTAPLDGAVFPADMAPPAVRWRDPGSRGPWTVVVDLGKGTAPLRLRSEHPWWRPAADAWAAIRHRGMQRRITVTVRRAAADGEDPTATASVGFTVSPDPVAAPILYREVPLPLRAALTALPLIRWRLGDVSSPDPPRVVLEGLHTCANCHSASADGRTLGMDIDYGGDKGTYLITNLASQTVVTAEDLVTWSDFRREEGHRTLGLLSRLSPDGRWAVSTVMEWSIQLPLPERDRPQLFFPVRGILALYDRVHRTLSALPGADEPELVQTNPEWSPDGRTLVFARAPALPLAQLGPHGRVPPAVAHRFTDGGERFRYNLYRIPFNGGAGGHATPLTGASHNGRSNYFPRYSPDGRWIVFCEAESFMLDQLDSALFIIPAAGGEARRLRCNFTGRMNSWHSFSPNGHWLVFASKATGPYTQLWLTHLDRDGRSSVPVLLEGFTAPERAANLPEFLNISPDGLEKIRVEVKPRR